MICKYSFGTPFETEAVVQALPESDQEPRFLTVRSRLPLCFSCRLGEEEAVYGLGESVRGMNKRGWIYENYALDQPHHHEDTRSLYSCHSFVIVSGPERVFGLFLDEPGRVIFDIGYACRTEMTITCVQNSCVLYEITGETEADIVQQYRRLIGRSYLPPKWAFGFIQSRWGYKDESDVRQVAQGYRDRQMALDGICMDIDYMERYKDFTVDPARFPDLAALAGEMKAQGVHLIPIIDAGVKIEAGYDVYEEGCEKGYFCTDLEGKPFVAAVWPGLVHFPDVLNPEARRWFGQKYKVLTELGIDGFWNDMNEPAIFYSKTGLDEAFKSIREMEGENLGLHEYFRMGDIIRNMSNSPQDYASFYHSLSDGSRVCHDRVHSLFGYNMTRAAGEELDTLRPGERTLLFSRSSYPGMHRYGGIWQGDNKTWCFLYQGADLGGFGCDTTEDLLLRWIAFGIFTPLMRNHSAMGTRQQELYSYPMWETFRDLISIRYMLLPYLYSEFVKCLLDDRMLFRPLAFDYRTDKRAREIEDQLLLGEGLMLAPVTEQNRTWRYVYLPEEMKLIRMKKAGQWQEEILPAGDHRVEIRLDEVVFFIRPDKLVPYTLRPGLSVAETDFDQLSILHFVKNEGEYKLYDDDGLTRDLSGEDRITTIRLTADGTLTTSGSKTVRL